MKYFFGFIIILTFALLLMTKKTEKQICFEVKTFTNSVYRSDGTEKGLKQGCYYKNDVTKKKIESKQLYKLLENDGKK